MLYSTEAAWLLYKMYDIYIFHGVCIEHESEHTTLIIPLKQIHVFGDKDISRKGYSPSPFRQTSMIWLFMFFDFQIPWLIF